MTDAEYERRKLINIGARLAATLWEYQEVCPECGNRKSLHMGGCPRTYEGFKGPQDAEPFFRKAFGIGEA